MNKNIEIYLWNEPHQDVSLQQQPRFNGDADACVAVSLHIAAVENEYKNHEINSLLNDQHLSDNANGRTIFLKCRPAAWPGRSSGKDGSLQRQGKHRVKRT